MFDTLLQIRLCGHKHVIYGLAWEESYSVLHADSPMHPRQFVVALLTCDVVCEVGRGGLLSIENVRLAPVCARLRQAIIIMDWE